MSIKRFLSEYIFTFQFFICFMLGLAISYAVTAWMVLDIFQQLDKVLVCS